MGRSNRWSARWRSGLGDDGFTALEVVVSLVVTSVVVLGSGAAMVTSARIGVASQQEIRYWTAIEYQAETLAASETLAAASASTSGLKTDPPEGSIDCSGYDATSPTLSTQLTDYQIKTCYNGMGSQTQTLSNVSSDWQLTDATAGRVLVIVDKVRPTEGLTKDTVVVYLYDS